MAILPVQLFPDPILRKSCRSVSHPNSPLVHKVLKDLAETMHVQTHGIGIAAPQCGLHLRIALVDVSAREPHKCLLKLINPEIKRQEGEILSREGCMSLPDYTANVKRFSKVWIEWMDSDGRMREKATEGIEAICLQHEIDHLNGILFIDRAGSLKTDVFPRRKAL